MVGAYTVTTYTSIWAILYTIRVYSVQFSETFNLVFYNYCYFIVLLSD